MAGRRNPPLIFLRRYSCREPQKSRLKRDYLAFFIDLTKETTVLPVAVFREEIEALATCVSWENPIRPFSHWSNHWESQVILLQSRLLWLSEYRLWFFQETYVAAASIYSLNIASGERYTYRREPEAVFRELQKVSIEAWLLGFINYLTNEHTVLPGFLKKHRLLKLQFPLWIPPLRPNH